MLFWEICVLAGAGALLRRWLGSSLRTPRWLELLSLGLLAGVIGWQHSPTLGVVLGMVAAVGWSIGHTWTRPWSMVARYGLFTTALGLTALVVTGDLRSLAVVPFGATAPLWYEIPRRLGVRWYTSVGELGLGASVYGGLALAGWGL